MRLHVLAVGQADALVLELPSGRLAVVDFGHRFLLEYLAGLDREGARRFAFCLLTHAHHDHYACLKEFVDRYDERVEEYWFSFASAGTVRSLLALQMAIAGGNRGRLLVQDLAAAQPFTLEPGVTVTRFAPNTSEILRPPGSPAENNRSVVLLIRHGRTAIVLGADAEEERWLRIEGQARAAGVSLAADVVKPPHHGAPPPRGLPLRLWSVLLRSPDAFVAFSVGRREERPALSTIVQVRDTARIRCTGRAHTCRLLPAHPALEPHQPAQDLIARALAPAPEARAVQSCFGTQVYEVDPAGSVALISAAQPAFLDACRAAP